MKIIMDAVPEDVEAHARFLHKKMLAESKLPRMVAATRAVIPTYCDFCHSEQAWGPVSGYAMCINCREARNEKSLGF